MRILEHLCRISPLLACKVAAVVLSCALGAADAAAAERSVCSEEDLAGAIESAAPGDEIVLCARNWTDTEIDFDVDGTESAPIKLRAETPGKVVLSGSSTLRLGGSYGVVDGLVWTGPYTGKGVGGIVEFRARDGRACDHCRLTNVAIIDYNPPDGKRFNWVTIHGQHNRVDHNYFSGKKNPGAILQVARRSNQPDHARIDYNFFSRPKLDQANGGESIQIADSGDYAASDSLTTVEANYFFEADGEIELISNKASGNVFRRNTFVGSGGELSIRQGNRVLVEGNYFLGDGKPLTGGVRVYGESHKIVNNYFEGLNPSGSSERGAIVFGSGDSAVDQSRGYYHYPPVRNVVVAHNTVVDSVNGIYFYGGESTGNVAAQNVAISNNIVAGQSSLVVEALAPQNVSYQGNLFDGPAPRAQVGETQNFFGKADLVSNGDEVLRLSNASMAVNAALPTGDVGTDIDGTERDGAPDIGADELRGDYRAPVRLCDAGPLTHQPGLKSSCPPKRRPAPPRNVTASPS